tara:strand:+ start:253 stop:1062 length:810 start_codon:yes stop_codon:yes gene_type:complete
MGFNELITNEDPYYLHKFFGFFVLINYIYQFSNFFLYNSVNLNTWSILPHLFLHYSSFIFKVLPYRIQTKQTEMFIWEELRLHSMIFASRACFTILFPNYRIIFVFLTMIFADLSSFLFGREGVSTVRGDHNKTSSKLLKQIYSGFFSSSQIGATIICGGFFQNHFSPILVFSTLPPIQTSAFGMTLIRKNIINKNIWQVVYTIELLLVYYMWYIVHNNLIIIPLNISCYLLRRINLNKYFLFIILTYLDFMYSNSFFIDYFSKLIQYS